MATPFKFSTDEFNELLEEQGSDTILKWSDLQVNEIYMIKDTKMINTQHGESCIVILHGGERVWSPSALTKKTGNHGTSASS